MSWLLDISGLALQQLKHFRIPYALHVHGPFAELPQTLYYSTRLKNSTRIAASGVFKVYGVGIFLLDPEPFETHKSRNTIGTVRMRHPLTAKWTQMHGLPARRQYQWLLELVQLHTTANLAHHKERITHDEASFANNIQRGIPRRDH